MTGTLVDLFPTEPPECHCGKVFRHAEEVTHPYYLDRAGALVICPECECWLVARPAGPENFTLTSAEDEFWQPPSRLIDDELAVTRSEDAWIDALHLDGLCPVDLMVQAGWR